VTLKHHTADGGDIAPRAPHRDGVDVGGVQLDPAQQRGERDAERPAAAAQVDHDDVTVHRSDERRGVPDEKLGTPPGYEHARVDGDPSAAELGPAEDVFEGNTGDPAG